MKRVCLVLAITIMVIGSVAFGFPTAASASLLAQGNYPSNYSSLQQPVSFKNPLVYIGKDGNVYMTDEASGEGSAITGDSTGGPQNTPPFFSHSLTYGQFAWSSDGKMLAFTERTQNTVYVVADGKAPVAVAKGVDAGFPPSFSPDGKEVGYVVKTSQQSGPDNANLVVQMQAVPALGGNPRALGSLEGKPWVCGADLGFDPGEAVYFNEIGLIGNSPMSFFWLNNGFLHTMSCTGRGLAFSNGAKDLWENPGLQNVALSADQKQALAILLADPKDPNSAKKLVIVDLSNGNLTPLDTQPNVDRAVWTSDGKSIVYSTVSAFRKVKADASKTIGTQLFQDHWPFPEITENGVFIFTMPAAGGPSTLIFKEAGRGIGSMSAAHNKPAISFSFVTSFARMIDAINGGNTLDKVLAVAPHAEIRIAPLDVTGFPTTVGIGGQSFYSPADTFSIIPAQVSVGVPTLVVPTLVSAAVTATPLPTLILPTATFLPPTPTPAIILPVGGVCPGFLPSRLHVGGQGRVLPGSSNRIRTTPSTGDIIGNMPPGSIFDVLEGPICTSNGIAWWRVRFGAIVGWTAEGQGSNYFLEPFTGAPPTATVSSSGTFGIVGVTAHVTPTSSSTCPTTFNFAGQIVVNRSGTVTYRWERSDGATGPVETITFGPGVTTIDVATSWNLGAAGTGWERIHVLTPNDVMSNQATFTLSCGGSAFAVTGVTASVSSPGGPSCPITYNFSATITTNGPGTVTYKWERSDGAGSATSSIVFGGAGSQTVNTSWSLGGPGTNYNGWERLHVLTPNDITSNQANFVLTCP